MPRVILASSSPYRAALLRRICGTFDTETPGVDETARPGESAQALALRLARAKANAIMASGAIVIGSDQTAACGSRILTKPGSVERQIEQLRDCRGQTVTFYTAVAVAQVDESGTGDIETHTNITNVRFRELDDEAIKRYVALDPAIDCAGGFRIEAAGPVLFDAVTTTDPTALIGLPLCWVSDALQRRGLFLPTPATD
ncbi:MAG: Maf family protein [Pseudomonadota bacterium]